MLLKKILDVFYGFVLSIILVLLGLLVTTLIIHGIAVIISIIIIFFVGIYLFINKRKQLAIGVFIGLIPIVLFTLSIIKMGRLH
ncbi:hypothetical protein [Tenacibaculum sp. M341]|uniref:hypothetical protein n=1 Tax=Tenacibaculum sp. M341 TaxID=2530339 RepID=UPI001044D629|nr:hypothetical protein [Tenacibaculum sp. M341]TCI90964.1 hypothetical protein EYW44_11470 [Tenacibaculum sp. M341]